MDNKCVCVSNYIEIDGKCKGLFGESCLDDTDCIVNNSKCEKNICQCPADYYVSENKDRCYRYAKGWWIIDWKNLEIWLKFYCRTD